MKNFTYADYKDQWPVLVNDFNQELAAELKLPIKFNHRIHGPGTITYLRAKLIGSDLEVVATYENKKKTPDIKELRQFLALDLVTLSEEDEKLMLDAQAMFKTACMERTQAINAKCQEEAAQRRQREAELEARRQAIKKQQQLEKRKQKNEAKLEESKAVYIEKFKELLASKKAPSVSDEFYYSLGWLAKHSGTVKAVVPDICEAEFVGYFGSDVPFTKTEYKVGPGGWISQWGKSFTASLVKVKTIPAYLEQYLNPKRNQITNSEYIKDLVDNYGFKFGKDQNLEAIRSSVPAEYRPHFEAGYAA